MAYGTRAAVLVLAFFGLACLWDTDTLRDEMQTQADDFDLITGQFPHHGKAYYEARIRKSLEGLKRDPTNRELRNDLAAGYLRVGRYEEAVREFERLRQERPGDYQTLSNMGVLYKKMGEFGKAAEYTAQALAIKPEGHLGLGDWYLKMLRYRRDTTAVGAGPPDANFLGTAYKDFPSIRLNEGDYKNLQLLVRADRTFADALLVLGDYLHRERHLNLALWAYARAQELGHPHAREVDRRMEAVLAHWKQAVAHEGKPIESPKETIRGIQEDLRKAAGWLGTFERTEAELVSAGAAVDFEAVERTMKAKGIGRFRPVNRGVLFFEADPETTPSPAGTKGLAIPTRRPSRVAPALLLGLLLSALVGVWAYRQSHRRVGRARRFPRGGRAAVDARKGRPSPKSVIPASGAGAIGA